HWGFSLMTHIHLHAKSQRRYAASTIHTNAKMNRMSFLGLIDNLESAIRKLKWRPQATEWADYYSETNYQSEAFTDKKRMVAQYLDSIHPKTVWDLGANTGVFSRLASEKGMATISFDLDPAAVEKNYLDCIAEGQTQLLPLILDVTNPSSGMGWANKERMSLAERGPADTMLALALIHHLAISNNTPLLKIAEFFSGICKTLIIEFVPKSDSQVQRLLATREDIFTDYHQPAFEREFGGVFNILDSRRIVDSERTLYLMENKPV
ncbi:MAG TPA: SAM-dependent methyltransferase, partial [Bacillota bacterium]|nr:SAM-dependent methyltransferase [Bacillota bacterium]